MEKERGGDAAAPFIGRERLPWRARLERRGRLGPKLESGSSTSEREGDERDDRWGRGV